MKKLIYSLLSLFLLSTSLSVFAAPSATGDVKASSLSKKQIQKGVNDGLYCTDEKGLAYSEGAIINHNDKMLRCVKNYGPSITGNKKLAWVAWDAD